MKEVGQEVMLTLKLEIIWCQCYSVIVFVDNIALMDELRDDVNTKFEC